MDRLMMTYDKLGVLPLIQLVMKFWHIEMGNVSMLHRRLLLLLHSFITWNISGIRSVSHCWTDELTHYNNGLTHYLSLLCCLFPLMIPWCQYMKFNASFCSIILLHVDSILMCVVVLMLVGWINTKAYMVHVAMFFCLYHRFHTSRSTWIKFETYLMVSEW